MRLPVSRPAKKFPGDKKLKRQAKRSKENEKIHKDKADILRVIREKQPELTDRFTVRRISARHLVRFYWLGNYKNLCDLFGSSFIFYASSVFIRVHPRPISFFISGKDYGGARS
jgi:hypothetical protein